MSDKKVVRRSVALALGLVCIVLAVGFVGVLAFYDTMRSEKDRVISDLNSSVRAAEDYNAGLRAQIAVLQQQVNDLLNVTGVSVGLDELVSNASAYLNTRIVFEGKISGPWLYIPEKEPPWNYKLSYLNGTHVENLGVVWSGGGSMDTPVSAVIVGVVRKGNWSMGGPEAYFVEAEKVVTF